FARERHANDGPDDTVQRDQALVQGTSQEEEQGSRASRNVVGELFPRDRAEERARIADDRADPLKDNGQRYERKYGNCPRQSVSREKEPPGEQCDAGGNVGQATAEIVENLPAGNDAQWIADEFAGTIRNTGKQPEENLPVAANPAVLAAAVSADVRRIVVDD